MEAALDVIADHAALSLWAGRPWLRLPPMLLHGPPGSGKTHFARRLGELAGTGSAVLSYAGVSSNAELAGNPRGFRHQQPCFPACAMQRFGTANPLIVIDEVEKARGSSNGDAIAALALLALAVTALGFWRTFFSQLGQVDAAHMIHGATSTGWLVLVLVQASLIRSRDFKLHRILGWASIALFTVLIVTSWHMLVLMLSPGNPLPFELAKIFAYSDVTALPLLLIAYAGAIIQRKDRHVHSRLISVTLLAGLLPAAARMFNRIWTGMDGLIFSMHPTYPFVLAVLGFAIYVDWKRDRLRWPFPFAFVWFAVSYATIFPAWQSTWFDYVARLIAGTA